MFDSWFDRFKGVIAHIALVDGHLKVGDHFTSGFSQKSYEVQNLGILHPDEEYVSALYVLLFVENGKR